MSKSIRPSQRILRRLQEHHTTLKHHLKQKNEEFNRLKDSEAWTEIHEISLFMREATQESRELSEYLQQFLETEDQEKLTPENSYIPADEMRPYILEALKGQEELTYNEAFKQVVALMQEYLMGADLETIQGKQTQQRCYVQFKKAVHQMKEAGMITGETYLTLSLTPSGQLAAEMLQGVLTYPIRRKLSAHSVRQHIPASGYTDAVLQILAYSQPMTSRQIMIRIGQQFQNKFSEADLEPLSSGRPRWNERAYAALDLLQVQGKVAYHAEGKSWTTITTERTKL